MDIGQWLFNKFVSKITNRLVKSCEEVSFVELKKKYFENCNELPKKSYVSLKSS